MSKRLAYVGLGFGLGSVSTIGFTSYKMWKYLHNAGFTLKKINLALGFVNVFLEVAADHPELLEDPRFEEFLVDYNFKKIIDNI